MADAPAPARPPARAEEPRPLLTPAEIDALMRGPPATYRPSDLKRRSGL
jgi:hypothetical protein